MSEIVKQEKAKRAKWNTDIINGLSVEYGFEVWKCSETHFRLFHPKRGPLNYWPSANKGKWDNSQVFAIPDIEAYLFRNFNPSASFDKTKAAYARVEQLENALRAIIRKSAFSPGNSWQDIAHEMKCIAQNALTPKTITDEQG